MRLIRFFRRRSRDEESARELESHLAIEIDDCLARGCSPDEARRSAYRLLGNPALIREEIYHMNSLSLAESFWQDLRYGARLLRANRTFAVVALATLALGTGANTAIFQLVDAVRLRALPVHDPERLVEIGIDSHDQGRTGRFVSRRPRLTDPIFQEVVAGQQVFSGIAAWASVTFDLAGGGESHPADGLYVNGAFFETLGVGAQAGRMLTVADDSRGCSSPAVVLSDAFWRRQFGADPGVVGRTLTLDGHAYQIVGVSARSFFGVDVGRSFDVIAPLCSEPLSRGAQSALGRRDYWFLAALARLKPGVSVAGADAQLQAISPSVFEATAPATFTPEDLKAYTAFTLTAAPAPSGVSVIRASYETPLWLLLGLTGLVLLIACANLANLMLARATARQREIAVRLAIGASRGRIMRQMLSESLLLALGGAAGGVLVAQWLSRFLVAFLSTEGEPLFVDLALDWRTLAFTTGLAVAACLLFGLAPALRATATSPGATMKAGSRGTTDGGERVTLRRALVVVQVALSLVLVAGALLFGRSLRNLATLDPGFRTDGVLIAGLDLRRAGVAEDERQALYRNIVERLRAVPGVRDAVQAFIIPISGSGWNNEVVVGGVAKPGNVNFNLVGPGYFRALGTTLIAGRDFDGRDGPGSPRVAIVSETFAKKYFSGAGPVGRTFQIDTGVGQPRPIYTVVGLVKDTKYGDLREPFTPIAFFDTEQEVPSGPTFRVVLHADTSLAGVAAGATRALADVNPSILVDYQTMDGLVRDSLLSERLMATLSGFFGGLAVLIATIGLYGVMSYAVVRRKVEIGIRMALGADRGAVVRLMIREAGWLVGIGLALGGLLAVVAGRSATSLLYGLEPWDPATLAIGMVGLALVALLASWLPARRASRLAPTVALRDE